MHRLAAPLTPALSQVGEGVGNLRGLVDVLCRCVQRVEKFLSRNIRLLEFDFEPEFPSRRFEAINVRLRSSRWIDVRPSRFTSTITSQTLLGDLLSHRPH